jgi:hypothetical protein
MPKITTKKEINLEQLDKELNCQGLCADFNDVENKIITTAEFSTITQNELEAAIEAHIALPEPELTIEEKLASVGLTIDDLKEALGL